MNDEQIKQLEDMMFLLGFTRISDYYDMGGCAPPISGSILQFFNPKTMEGMQISIGEYNDDLMFGEDFTMECDELMSGTPREPLRVTRIDDECPDGKES